MHLRSLVTLAFAGFAIASANIDRDYAYTRRSVLDAPAARSGIATVIAAITEWDNSLKQVTAENVATSLKDLNQKSHALGTAFESAAKTISASGPLKGVQDSIGLMTPGQRLMTLLNTTSLDLMAKYMIIKNSKQGELVADGLRSIKAGVIPFQNALSAQIPANWKGTDTAAPGAFALTDKQISDILDDLINQIGAIIDNKAATFTIPASFPIPSGLAGLLGAGFPAAAGGLPAAVPGTTPAPVAVPGSPKGPSQGDSLARRFVAAAEGSPKRSYVVKGFRA